MTNKHDLRVSMANLRRRYGAVLSSRAAWLAFICFFYPPHALSVTTETRDPVRGVTFYSTEISTDEKNKLQLTGGLFSSSDVMTLGLSAFLFDESKSVDEYIIWLRHDGPRRWFVGQIQDPVEIHLEDGDIQPEPFHQSRFPQPNDELPFIEKLEFALTPVEFQAITDSAEVTVEVRTLLGTVVKDLSDDELDAIRQFAIEVKERHEENGLSAL